MFTKFPAVDQQLVEDDLHVAVVAADPAAGMLSPLVGFLGHHQVQAVILKNI